MIFILQNGEFQGKQVMLIKYITLSHLRSNVYIYFLTDIALAVDCY